MGKTRSPSPFNLSHFIFLDTYFGKGGARPDNNNIVNNNTQPVADEWPMEQGRKRSKPLIYASLSHSCFNPLSERIHGETDPSTKEWINGGEERRGQGECSD